MGHQTAQPSKVGGNVYVVEYSETQPIVRQSIHPVTNAGFPQIFSNQNLRTFDKLLRTQMTEMKTKNQYASYRK